MKVPPTGSLNFTQVQVGKDTFKAVATFKYLGDVIEESGGCVDATSARITIAWKGFRQLLLIITNCGIPLKIEVISSAPVLERTCGTVAKHGQHPAKQ